MIRKILIGLLIVLIVLLLGAAWYVGPYLLLVEHFQADPTQGYHADFYLYVSPGAKAAAERGESVTLLIQPNNSGTNSDDPAIHRRDAWWTGFERHQIANELEVVLLVPAFIRPGEEWWIYSHALDRDTLTTKRVDVGRPDLQLLAMVDATRSRLNTVGILTDDKFLIQGFSASGMFANRFAVLHPERVKAVTTGSPGGWPILPVAEHVGVRLNYPIGIADLETMTGKPFDIETFRQVPQLIYMGSVDNNDSLDFSDSWEAENAQIVNELFGDTPIKRWDMAKDLHASVSTNIEFLLVDGVGHDRKALQSHSTAFFANVLDGD